MKVKRGFLGVCAAALLAVSAHAIDQTQLDACRAIFENGSRDPDRERESADTIGTALETNPHCLTSVGALADMARQAARFSLLPVTRFIAAKMEAALESCRHKAQSLFMAVDQLLDLDSSEPPPPPCVRAHGKAGNGPVKIQQHRGTLWRMLKEGNNVKGCLQMFPVELHEIDPRSNLEASSQFQFVMDDVMDELLNKLEALDGNRYGETAPPESDIHGGDQDENGPLADLKDISIGILRHACAGGLDPYNIPSPQDTSTDAHGITPLMEAAQHGMVRVVDFLIDRTQTGGESLSDPEWTSRLGRRLTARNSRGDTAMALAAKTGHFEVLATFVDLAKETQSNVRKCKYYDSFWVRPIQAADPDNPPAPSQTDVCFCKLRDNNDFTPLMQIAVQPAQSRQFTAFSVLHLLYASFPENQPDSSVSEEDYLALPGCDGLHENHRTRKEGWTPLMLAAHVGNQDAGVALLEMQGTSVQTKWTPEGWNGPATHDAQIDPEAHRDVNQVSALFHAAASGSTWLAAQIMWHLIKKSPGDAKKIFKRAEIKFTTDGESDLIKELSVVDFALYHKKTSTTAVIIQKMKELAAREDSGISIEHYIPAEGRENTDAVDELLDQKAELHGELVENAVTHWGEIQRGSTLQEAINEFLSKRGVV